MRTHVLVISMLLAASALSPAQDAAASGKPQVKINYINVCAPSDEERKEMAAALARIPTKPGFSGDFEVARGRTTISPESLAMAAAALSGAQAGAKMTGGEGSTSQWVRLRRDFSASPFATAQYTVSFDDKGTSETFVFRIRELKKDDIVQVALEDSVTTADPSQVVTAETPVDHVKVERFGKGSLGLRRCGEADQSSLEPLFQTASQIANRYRAALGVKATVPGDLKRITAGTASPTTKKAKPAGKAAGETKPAPSKSN